MKNHPLSQQPIRQTSVEPVSTTDARYEFPAAWRQLLVLAMLTVQNASLTLLTKYSYRENAIAYTVSTVVASGELLKLLLSCILVYSFDGKGTTREAFHEVRHNSLRLAIPSLLYVAQNNLNFLGMRYLSATAYIVCSQSKILTSALWSVLLLRAQITPKQYTALMTLVCGMILVHKGEEHRTRASADLSDSRWSGALVGAVVVFCAAFISGFAGAWLEMFLKENGGPKRSLWFRNVQLACISLPLASFAAIWRDGKRIETHGIFRGYDAVVLVIIILQALGGMLVSAVLKYASNVLKCFAVSMSICICATVTTFAAHDHEGTVVGSTIFGILLVIGSTFIYSGVI